MGFNTGILLLNDALYAAEQDKDAFATNLLRAVGEHMSNRGEPLDFAIGNNVNGGTVFHQSHADFVGIYAIGGNYVTPLLTRYNYVHHTYEAKLAIVREMADELGCRLVAKPKTRRKPVIK